MVMVIAVDERKGIEQALGGLLEGMRRVQQDIDSIRADMRADAERAVRSYETSEQRASEHRRRIYDKTDELVGRVSDTEDTIGKLAGTVEGVKLVTDEVTRWKHMGIGALGVVGIAFAAIGSVVTYYWAEIVRALRGV